MTGTAPDPAPDLTELDLVRQLTRRLRRLEVHAARWGLSPHQARALGVLAREDDAAGARVGALAARLQVAPRSATEVADALQELGLVERRPDPADRRAVRLVLTARGREGAADLHRQRHQVAERVLAGLDDAERRPLMSLLARLLEAAADDDWRAGSSSIRPVSAPRRRWTARLSRPGPPPAQGCRPRHRSGTAGPRRRTRRRPPCAR